MIFIFLLFLVHATIYLNPSISLAQTATPTATTSEEIQKLREVVSQKVAEKLRQITNPASTKKAFIGKIIQIDADTISVDYQNATRIINIKEETTFVDSKGAKIKLSSIKIGQELLIMGNNEPEATNFTAKRIVIINSATIYTKRTVVIGKVVDISRTSPIFSLIPIKNKNDLFQIKTDTKTEVLDPKHQKIKLTDLKSGQKIIAILEPDTKNSKTYSAITLINQDHTPSPTPTKK